jgi:hypothetical protein
MYGKVAKKFEIIQETIIPYIDKTQIDDLNEFDKEFTEYISQI